MIYITMLISLRERLSTGSAERQHDALGLRAELTEECQWDLEYRSPSYSPPSLAAVLTLAYEHARFSGRPLWQVSVGSVFDRFPTLKIIFDRRSTPWDLAGHNSGRIEMTDSVS
jgi:hypothetical protein